jgi:hypothetical protein
MCKLKTHFPDFHCRPTKSFSGCVPQAGLSEHCREVFGPESNHLSSEVGLRLQWREPLEMTEDNNPVRDIKRKWVAGSGTRASGLPGICNQKLVLHDLLGNCGKKYAF